MFKIILLSILLSISAFNLTLSAQAYPDRHSTTLSEGWISCQTSANPNPIRGNGHWINYNLGDTYALTTSKIWNFNTPVRVNSYNNEGWSLSPLNGKLEDGMKDVIIDISKNGTTWEEWGRFTIPKAPGSSFYEGTFGPDFGGKIARYVLITAVSNHGGSCYGLSEIKFNGTIATVSNTDDPLGPASLTASPNPFSDFSIVKLSNFPFGDVNLTLLDLNGRIVFRKIITIKSKTEEFSLSGQGLPAGSYFLQASQNDRSRSIKIELIK